MTVSKRIFNKPVVLISRCIGFDAVRYNGDMISSHEVEMMKPYVSFIPVCPEVEIGLGIPRDTIRIVRIDGDDHLIQPSTGVDLTDRMNTFCSSYLQNLPLVDGFLLKFRSPTSGISGVNIYATTEKSAAIGKGAGFFGRMVLDTFAGYPIEDEGRIRNTRVRDHFLTRIFMLSDLDNVLKNPSLTGLTRFHAQNKLALMAYSQATVKTLGNVAANRNNLSISEMIALYRRSLIEGTKNPARYTSHINVLHHAMGYFSDELSPDEKTFFLNSVEDYRNGNLPISALKKMLLIWIIKYTNTYLSSQTYFAPYPEPLMELDSSLIERGRDMYTGLE
ncbi:MAG TPA: DUF523 and DUF1722 domain-containing protein [Methanospirillum sp.]|uniref:YbgA family protein n=1 Tax=Methanospirillum sp. TaxID=45200 RepID=UPI002C98D22D|nr:DUF523 and DUF1722 domain-containing protein [Methanospirillum sp.]HWQ63443.1 DUF523 and DUF1722 domain-containing protein [Methanospirillum sp.]